MASVALCLTVNDYSTDGGQARCVYGPGNCSLHSFTFASANNLTTGSYICAEIYHPADHSPPVGQACQFSFIRYCHGPTHQAGAEHCIDQNANMWHVGARNYYSGSQIALIRRHVVY